MTIEIALFRPGCYPYDQENVNSVIVYFTLHFSKAVDDPLKPLQEHLSHYKTLAGKVVFNDSLMLTGKNDKLRNINSWFGVLHRIRVLSYNIYHGEKEPLILTHVAYFLYSRNTKHSYRMSPSQT